MDKEKFKKKYECTKDELHDLMMKSGKESTPESLRKNIDEELLSSIVYEFIDYHDTYIEKKLEKYGIVSNEDIRSDFFKNNNINIDVFNTQFYFKNYMFFKCNDNKYVYCYTGNNIKIKKMYTSLIKFYDGLMKYYDKLSSYYIYFEHEKNIYKRNLKLLNNQGPKGIINKFKKYDYINVLSEKNKITLDDVWLCTQVLGLENYNKIKLTEEQSCILLLIIFYGLKNTYFNNSDLYKYRNKEVYNGYLDNLDSWIKKIKNYKDVVSDKMVYSNDFSGCINLKEELKLLYSCRGDYIIRHYYDGIYNMMEFLELLYFESLINRCKYKKARDYLNKNTIPLYSFIETTFSSPNDDWIIKYLLNNVYDDYDFYNNKNGEDRFNEIFNDKVYINYYMKPALHFIVNYFYLIKHENKTREEKILYSFLKVFNNGFGLEDFINKYELEKALLEINDMKTSDKEKINEVFDEMAEKIMDKNLVDDSDLKNLQFKYPYIKFDNLDSKVVKYIATGNAIMSIFNKTANDTYDYSSAVIEWCKAVELETYTKITQKIIDYKDDINRNIIGKPIVLGSNLGTIDYMYNNNMKNGQSMVDYLYDRYFSKIYNIDNKSFIELINNIEKIYNPRNDSAHKDVVINDQTAKDCQNYVLSAKKILETLSNLNS